MGTVQPGVRVRMHEFLCVMLCLLGQSVWAGSTESDQAAAWLDRMSHAVKETDYQGVLVFGGSHAWQTLSVSHMVVEGIEYEKIVHLTGEPREIVRVGHETTCTHPGDHAVRSHSASVGGLADTIRDNISQIQRHYNLNVTGKNRVAGRAAVSIDVISKDAYRYDHRLWLDEETGLLLRSDLLGKHQHVLERYQFAHIEIGKRLPFSEFDASGRGHRIAPHLESSMTHNAQSDLAWQPQWVPAGFSQTARDQKNQRISAMYTDGLAAFSVFVESAIGEPMPDMNNRWGAISAVVVNQSHAGQLYRITLVGELPLSTARKIAHSVSGSVADEANQ